MFELDLPLEVSDIMQLHAGDGVLLSGVIVTARDTAHRWMFDTFIRKTREPSDDDIEVYEKLKPLLEEGAVYHCGPVVDELKNGEYRITAAGPTTSIREEPYQADVMRHFNLRAVIGKGGMGARTLDVCRELPAVYLHAVGGAAALIAKSIRRVAAVYKLDFGVPEAMWVIEVAGFPAVVTMDAHGTSMHDLVRNESGGKLQSLLKARREEIG